MVPNGATTTANYTPLEALLFFQSLRAQNLRQINFKQISDDLNAIPLVKNDAAFDQDRLSAGALRDLYLALVKEEARQEKEQNLLDKPDVDSAPVSRKRKLSSPPLSTVEAALEHIGLFPRLLQKLYARYRETVAAAIQEEELAVKRIEDEISEAATRLEENDSRVNGPAGQIETSDSTVLDVKDSADEKPKQEAHQDGRPRSSKASIDALVNPTSDPSTTGTPATTKQPPRDIYPSTDVVGSAVRPSPGAISSTQTQQNSYAQLPYQASPPVKPASPYLGQHPYQSLRPGAAPSPPAQHTAPIQSPSSPNRTLPLPNGLKTGSSPVMQNGFAQSPRQPGPMQPPQYGSPIQGRSPVPVAPAGRGYPPPQYAHYQQGYPPYQGVQQQYMPTQQQPQYQVRPSQQGGFQLPPFQVAAQDPSKVHHQYPQQTTPQRGQYPPPAASSRIAQSPYSQQSTPFPSFSTPHSQRTQVDDEMTRSVVATLRKRRSTSTWKALDHPPLTAPRSPARPPVEPNSPVRSKPDIPMLDESEASHDAITVGKTSAVSSKNSLKKPPRKDRGSSVVSSSVPSTRGRTRSQSIISNPPDASASLRTSTRNARASPPSTPAADDTTDTPHQRTITRTRRGTLLQPPSSVARTDTSSHRRSSRVKERNDVVHATRNFARLSNVILSEITAHRHAGPFTKPVSERDVEGYAEIIKRPQDLKSIKAAVTAGGRIVAARAKELADEGQEDAAGGSGTLVLPKTVELVPPRGIVNSAQLEMEVMRLFANAVMFNTGQEGIVADAREMAADVEGKIADWRGIEGRSEEADEEGGGGKRRRL